MIKHGLFLLLILFHTYSYEAFTTIESIQESRKTVKGKVVDKNQKPLEFVNVFIKGTMDGTTTTEDGYFEFQTSSSGEVVLIFSYVGYEPYNLITDIHNLNGITITLKSKQYDLNEVVVTAGNYMLKSASSIQEQNTIDLVTTAGSEGDLFKAIALLPGSQVAGTDGRLLIRGGESRETQTYIDGMHALSVYNASAGNTGGRSRYSPFLFEGVNFSMGGYSTEYSQSLSAVLPLYTKNKSKDTKIGVDVMNVSLGSGGTVAWKEGSSSFNFNLTDLGIYNKVFDPNTRMEWNKPYRHLSAENQLRFEFGKDAYLKTYMTYDKVNFDLNQTKPFTSETRGLKMDEDNIYLNSTFNKKFKSSLKYFIGIAYSFNSQTIDNAIIINDRVKDKKQELHLKTKMGKRLTNLYRLDVGVESYIKQSNLEYNDTLNNKLKINRNITGIYLSNDFNITDALFLNLSTRLEHSSTNQSYALLPRIALSYQLKKWNFSGILGVYQQSAEDTKLMRNKNLLEEKNTQMTLNLYYQNDSKLIRVEGYSKKYSKLGTIEKGIINSHGQGYSRGIDLYFSDTKLYKYWEYMLAYSFNDTKKRYDSYQEKITPSYVTRHNASLVLKYSNFNLRSIISISTKVASGRPYHNPNKTGIMNSHTPIYNSVDISYTFLAHRNLIIYASLSNILNRKNIYGYNYSTRTNEIGQYERLPIQLQQNQTFYIGFFINIGKNIAYEPSHF